MAFEIIILAILGVSIGGLLYCLGYRSGVRWAGKTFKAVLSQIVDNLPTEEEKPWSI